VCCCTPPVYLAIVVVILSPERPPDSSDGLVQRHKVWQRHEAIMVAVCKHDRMQHACHVESLQAWCPSCTAHALLQSLLTRRPAQPACVLTSGLLHPQVLLLETQS
jgi:hypothetical protein